MEIDGQRFIGAFHNIHFENQPCRQGKQGAFEPFEAIGFALFDQIHPLKAAAAPDRRFSEILPGQALLLCFVAQQIQPHSAMFQLFTDGLQYAVFMFGFIGDAAHAVLLCVISSL